jgi:hypothetical protein
MSGKQGCISGYRVPLKFNHPTAARSFLSRVSDRLSGKLPFHVTGSEEKDKGYKEKIVVPVVQAGKVDILPM